MLSNTGSVLLELCAGALCLGAASLVLQAGTDLDPSLPRAARTPAPSAPPPVLGPRYDSDAALPARADDVASYRIEARLDADTHTIRGKATIVWRNASAVPADEIWLHLYLNAFKNERSLFLRSPFGAGRSGERAKNWGHTDVERLVARELDGVDLWPKAARHSPDDPDDETDIRVPLPGSIAPGDTLTLDVEFSSRLPQIVERTGYSGDFHFAGQWYPKLARREPDGTWAHFAFHPLAEFYADYGRYEVTLDVPEAMVLGATGVRVEERRAQGRLTARYIAENVHDFAWTAWPGFREHVERIDGTEVRFLTPRGHDRNLDVTAEALRFSLPRLNRLYGRYPHPSLTVVHPPEHARNAGGMEYPMLITTGGPWYAAQSGVRAVEAVTVHELGHQWFQGLLGTNEHAWPFLDEGLTTYVEATTLSAAYGSGSLIEWPGLSISDDAARRALAVSYGQDLVVALPAPAFPSIRHVGALVYARTSTILTTLGNVYGEAELQRALGRYARRYRFQHPNPRHFVAAVRELLGKEAAENLERALFERGSVDFSLESVQSVPTRVAAGVFDGPDGRQTKLAYAEPATQWESRVLAFRHGTLVFPVDVEIWLKNGERVRKRWDGRGASTAITHRGSSPAVAAVIDPDRRVTLDDDLSNNSVRSAGGGAVPRVWERALYAAALAFGGAVP